MHMRLWAATGIFGSILALMLTYFTLEPGTFASRYADVLGWSTVVAFLLLMIQGFWSRRRRIGLSTERKQLATVSYQLALFEWGGMHTALSIVVTVFLVAHGFLLLPGLLEPSLALWLGTLAFLILLLLNFSGLMTESRENRAGSACSEISCLANVCSVSSLSHACGGGGIDFEPSHDSIGHDSGISISTLRLDYHSPNGSARSTNLKVYGSLVSRLARLETVKCTAHVRTKRPRLRNE